MNRQILKYKPEYENDILSAISQDPDWDFLANANASAHYKKRLSQSISYVCYDENGFCGYVRALLDEGLAVYVSELFVIPEQRNQHIGRSLITQIKQDFLPLTVYVLSDEDAYYEKLKYKKVGSVFEVTP